MSLQLVSVRVVTQTRTRDGGAGYTPGPDVDIAGSPFLARVYRVPQKEVREDDAAPGTTTVDRTQRLSIYNPAAPVAEDCIALLPRLDGSVQRAKVVRPRYYDDRIQCDLETGASE